ncbi:MAG TPA: mechanosensitive ion channel family protein [Anaerolineales bacterium]|nr:mechanosensitive ion channel family protein [Anaerolineales bacterium]
MPTKILWGHLLSASELVNQIALSTHSGNTGLESHQVLEFAFMLLWLIVLPISIPLMKSIFNHLSDRIEKWSYTHFQALRIYRLEIKLPNNVIDKILRSVKVLQGAAIFLVMSLGALLVFGLYPQTRGIVQGFFGKALEILRAIGQCLVVALPDLVALIAIGVFTFYTLRLIRFLSNGFKQGKVKLSGLHPDLVEPTFQIIRFLIICLALVAAYPYIPGSESPAFRYISIFIGFLLSLGSTSLVSNIVAGIVLTYMRGMKIGDRVQIAETVGDVIDRTLLVTRIRTIKNVVITIPNGLVLNSHIVNFSASAERTGLILHTSVTIGYDVPWRQVHLLLIQAAEATEHILEDPEPFVFQTSLNDYYVTYELNAYTRNPEKMAPIFSELHQNIQDYFNAAGVEILSPAYSAFRDGHPSTIPSGSQPMVKPPATYQPGDILHTFMQGISIGARKSNQ